MGDTLIKKPANKGNAADRYAPADFFVSEYKDNSQQERGVVVENRVIKIESESELGKTYEVNLVNHSCSCLHYVKKLHKLSDNDPHRLCKHLVFAMANSEAFEGFEQFRDEILWFAQQKSAYSSKEKALNKKIYPPKKPPKDKIPPGSIQTVSREVTEQPDIGSVAFYLWCEPGIYYHIKGKVNEVTLETIIPEKGGIGLYSINGQRAHEYNFGESKSDKTDIGGEENDAFTISLRFEMEPAPKQYKHLHDALFFWLDEEYGLIASVSKGKKR